MVSWKEVGDLGWNEGVGVDGFVVVGWGFFGWFARRFFRVSVVE